MDDAMREVRRLRRSAWIWRGAGVLAVAWAMFRPVGAVEPQRGERRTADVERLVIRDGQGRIRAVLGCWSDSIILDGKIQPVADSTVGLKLFGKKDPEDPQASFTARQDGGNTIRIPIKDKTQINLFFLHLGAKPLQILRQRLGTAITKTRVHI